MESVARELAEVLAARGGDGALIYSERDVTVGIAILAALEGTNTSTLQAARRHVEHLYAWAGVNDRDNKSTAEAKIQKYLDLHPLHPALMRQFKRVLRGAISVLADPTDRSRIGSSWTLTARRETELQRSQGSVLHFRLNQTTRHTK